MPNIIHLTDSHIDVNNDNDRDRFKRIISYLNKKYEAHDLIIHTGDLCDRGDVETYKYLYKIISESKIPFCAVPGNHDDSGVFNEIFSDLFEYQDDLNQTVRVINDYVFIFLDTTKVNEESGYLCSVRLKWLVNTLRRYEMFSIYIVMHHPPVSLGMDYMDNIKLKNGNEFYNVLKNFNQLKHIFFGHVHKNTNGNWKGIPYSCLTGDSFELFDFKDGLVCETINDVVFNLIEVSRSNISVNFNRRNTSIV